MNNQITEKTIFHQSILQFLSVEFDIDSKNFKGNTPLISSGLIDSVGVLDFVEFVVKSTGIQVDPSEVRLNNFDSVDLVMDFVARKVAR